MLQPVDRIKLLSGVLFSHKIKRNLEICTFSRLYSSLNLDN